MNDEHFDRLAWILANRSRRSLLGRLVAGALGLLAPPLSRSRAATAADCRGTSCPSPGICCDIGCVYPSNQACGCDLVRCADSEICDGQQCRPPSSVSTPSSQPSVSAGFVCAPPDCSIVAQKLVNPYGMVWGPAGILYVASAGVPPDLDAGRPGLQAGVVKLQGEVRSIITPFITNVSWAPIFDVIGVTDVALLDQQLYMLVASGTAATNGVYRIDAERIITSPGNVVEGIVVQIAESAGWLSQYPPAETPPEGFPNPGVPFAMVAGDDRLWVVDALNGLVLSITPDGTIGLAADLSPGHPLPTGIALAPDGGLYIGTLTRPPFPPGGAKVLHISDDGTVSDAWTGLTAVTGVVVGPTGVLYASEMLTGDSAEHEGSTAGSGRVVRQTGPDSSEVIATGLRLPTALDIGRDGALYVALSYPVGVSEDSALDGAIIRLALS